MRLTFIFTFFTLIKEISTESSPTMLFNGISPQEFVVCKEYLDLRPSVSSPTVVLTQDPLPREGPIQECSRGNQNRMGTSLCLKGLVEKNNFS